jgi:negative regulator of sigma E activity
MWQIRTDKLDMAKANYTLRLVGRDKVAERFCLVLQLEPKEKGNAIRKVWVHPPTRLPLQVERYSPDGQLEIRIAFTEVKINEPLPLLILEPSVPSDWTVENLPPFQRRRVDISQAREVLGFEPILPSWLPQGYILEGIFALGDQRWKMAHIVYTDGIGVISVFQHPASPKRRQPTERPHHQGRPFGAFPIQRMFPQRAVIRDIGNLRVVLVSEVAREWLERMANSMTPTAAAR